MRTVSFSLALLAVLAVIFALYWGRAFFIPMLVSVMISYALSPIVNTMQGWRVPRAVSTGILLIGIVGGVSSLTYSLSDQAADAIENLPQAALKFRQALRLERGSSESAIDKIQKATTEMEKAASDTPTPAPPLPAGVTRVQVEKSKISIQDYLWAGTMGVAGFAGQVVIVFFLSYVLIVSGDSFRRKLVRINGPTFSRRKITLQMLDRITAQIQHYLLVQLFTCILVGLATWLAFLWVGLEHAAIWGIGAGILNAIPYLGTAVVTIAAALVAFLQFGTFGMAFAVGGIALVISNLEGLVLTPWLTGRATQMNAVAIFSGVLFWGWLWGIWGLLLGIPILMVLKAICDHVEDLKPVGELLEK